MITRFFHNPPVAVAEPAGSSMGTRVRRALHTPGQLGGGARGRDRLEYQFDLGLSLGAGADHSVRSPQRQRDSGDVITKGPAQRSAGQR